MEKVSRTQDTMLEFVGKWQNEMVADDDGSEHRPRHSDNK